MKNSHKSKLNPDFVDIRSGEPLVDEIYNDLIETGEYDKIVEDIMNQYHNERPGLAHHIPNVFGNKLSDAVRKRTGYTGEMKATRKKLKKKFMDENDEISALITLIEMR